MENRYYAKVFLILMFMLRHTAKICRCFKKIKKYFTIAVKIILWCILVLIRNDY